VGKRKSTLAGGCSWNPDESPVSGRGKKAARFGRGGPGHGGTWGTPVERNAGHLFEGNTWGMKLKVEGEMDSETPHRLRKAKKMFGQRAGEQNQESPPGNFSEEEKERTTRGK